MSPASWIRCHTHVEGVPWWSCEHLPDLGTSWWKEQNAERKLKDKKRPEDAHTYKNIQTHTNTNKYYYGSVAAIWNDLVQETSLTFHCSPSGTRVAEWGQVVEKPRKRLLGTPRNWRSTYYIFPHDIWFLNCFNSNIFYSFYTVIYLTQLCVLSMPIHKELFGSIWRQIRPKVCEWPLLRHQSNIS